jgi:hypothetical protein
LAKQTSTPPLTNVRTRLSAPFIHPLPFAKSFELPKSLSRQILKADMDQSLFAPAVKGFGWDAMLPSPTGGGHRRRERRFFSTLPANATLPHAAVACEIRRIMASLVSK